MDNEKEFLINEDGDVVKNLNYDPENPYENNDDELIDLDEEEYKKKEVVKKEDSFDDISKKKEPEQKSLGKLPHMQPTKKRGQAEKPKYKVTLAKYI